MSIYQRMLHLVEDESVSAIARKCAQCVIDDMLRHGLVNVEDLV